MVWTYPDDIRTVSWDGTLKSRRLEGEELKILKNSAQSGQYPVQFVSNSASESTILSLRGLHQGGRAEIKFIDDTGRTTGAIGAHSSDAASAKTHMHFKTFDANSTELVTRFEINSHEDIPRADFSRSRVVVQGHADFNYNPLKIYNPSPASEALFIDQDSNSAANTYAVFIDSSNTGAGLGYGIKITLDDPSGLAIHTNGVISGAALVVADAAQTRANLNVAVSGAGSGGTGVVFPLAIASGGTASTTAADARVSLNVAASGAAVNGSKLVLIQDTQVSGATTYTFSGALMLDYDLLLLVGALRSSNNTAFDMRFNSSAANVYHHQGYTATTLANTGFVDGIRWAESSGSQTTIAKLVIGRTPAPSDTRRNVVVSSLTGTSSQSSYRALGGWFPFAPSSGVASITIYPVSGSFSGAMTLYGFGRT